MTGILVVDDEQVVLDAATRILTEEGFEVHGTLDAESALALLDEVRTDLAVVDLKLPGMSGLDFIEAARSTRPDLPVIVTTGISSVDVAIEALKEGAFDFLPKPFTFEELLGPVYRASRYHSAGPPSETPPERKPPGYLFLGMQSWAKLEPDGVVRIGASDVFARTAGNVRSVSFPEPDDRIRQGGRVALVHTSDSRSHVVLSPVSGTVLKTNAAVSGDPESVNDDPLAGGWLAIVRPSDLQHELENLHSEGAAR